VAALLLPVVLYTALVLRLILHERSLNQPPVRGRLLVSTADAHVEDMRDVRIPVGKDFELGAWYVPPRNGGAAVILTHGSGSDRSSTLAEVRILAAAGLGVLSFDWPGHGTSGGESHWGRDERRALSDAVSWLAVQPGVDREQIGIVGFSIGGYIVAQVAATDTRMRRIALVAAPTDADVQTMNEYKRYGRLAGWLVVKANEWSGIEPDTLKARELVAKISPRPLLIITGGLDRAVPTEMSDTLFLRAGEPKTFIRLPRSAHGDYAVADSAAYATALIGFFSAGRAASR
jgi:uncharacterized protein